jgi:outer membrane protein TolC
MKNIFRITFVLMVLAALNPLAAQQQLSLEDAVGLASTNNQEINAGKLEIEKTHQQKVVARSLFLPTIGITAQANHFFKRTPFFGFGGGVAGISERRSA